MLNNNNTMDAPAGARFVETLRPHLHDAVSSCPKATTDMHRGVLPTKLPPKRDPEGPLPGKCREKQSGCEQCPFVTSLIEAFVDLLALHAPKELAMIDPKTTQDMFRWLHQDSLESLVQKSKFWFAAPLAHCLCNDAPEAPSDTDIFPFYGRWKRWFRSRAVSCRANARPFLVNIFEDWHQCKRRMPALPARLVDEAKIKAMNLLGSECPELPVELLKDFSQKTKQILRSLNFRHRYAPTSYPSTNSCFENPLASGGQSGFIRDTLIAEGLANGHSVTFVIPVVEDGKKVSKTPKLRTEVMYPWHLQPLLRMHHAPTIGVTTLRGVEVEPHVDLIEKLWHKMPSMQDRHPFKNGIGYKGTGEYHFLSSSTADGSGSVKVEAVCEPLKVRCITKAAGVSQWMCKSLQQSMHQSLRKFAPFALIGKDVNELDELALQDICNSDPNFKDYVAGDFASATDRLNIRVTMACFESVLDLSADSERYKDKYRSMLYQQMIYADVPSETWNSLSEKYPNVYLSETKFGRAKICADQQNGQLMGSILSFPILCLANLISYWRALEEYYQVAVPLKDLAKRVLVNGDDIFFTSNPEFYKVWWRHVEEIGLVPSVGKNIYHSRYSWINSRRLDLKHLSQKPYINIGMLNGRSKVQGEKDEETPLTRLRGLWSQCGTKSLTAWFIFERENRRQLRDFSCHGLRNYFIPEYLGGLGFKLPDDYKNRVTRMQYAMAISSIRGEKNSITESVTYNPWSMLLKRSDWGVKAETVGSPFMQDLVEEDYCVERRVRDVSSQHFPPQQGFSTKWLYESVEHHVFLRNHFEESSGVIVQSALDAANQMARDYTAHPSLDGYQTMNSPPPSIDEYYLDQVNHCYDPKRHSDFYKLEVTGTVRIAFGVFNTFAHLGRMATVL